MIRYCSFIMAPCYTGKMDETKNCLNRTKATQAIRCRITGPQFLLRTFIENIGQSVRYILEIQRELFSENSIPVCQKWDQY